MSIMTSAAAAPLRVRREAAAVVLLVGFGVALALGLYARLHTPARKPIFLLGFSGMLQMKAWVSTAALFFVLVQVATALWMWGRLPGRPVAPGWVPDLHHWSGAIGFALSLPVAFHCVWSLGYVTTTSRVAVHCTAGCLFYGAYAAKMLGLRVRGLPGWAVPVLGGTVFTLFLVVWFTSALWLFTRHGIALT
jgi:hypothetical protein